MIAFLIDADNLSSPSWIDDAFNALANQGVVTIRRAYGSAENLKGISDTLRTWLIRPCVNLLLSKNTTDLSLAVDAMELACQVVCPSTIVIGSGDSDFVPLVVRLRERGVRMICISERGKMSQEAFRAYDQVIFVGNEKTERTNAPVQRAKSAKDLAKPPPAANSVKKPPMKVATSQADSAKVVPAKKAATKQPIALGNTVTVSRILIAAPALATGQWHPLGEVAKVLHDQKLLAKSASSTKLFKSFQHHFELMPAKQPNQVRYVLPT